MDKWPGVDLKPRFDFKSWTPQHAGSGKTCFVWINAMSTLLRTTIEPTRKKYMISLLFTEETLTLASFSRSSTVQIVNLSWAGKKPFWNTAKNCKDFAKIQNVIVLPKWTTKVWWSVYMLLRKTDLMSEFQNTVPTMKHTGACGKSCSTSVVEEQKMSICADGCSLLFSR